VSIWVVESDGQAPSPDPLLSVSTLSAFYGEMQAIDAVDLDIRPGETLAIIGANGAGKSTLLCAIAGLMSNGGGASLRGRIDFVGHRVDSLEPDAILDLGIALVPEGRRLFSRMSVEDNLLCGAYLPRCRPQMRSKLAEIYAVFPRLGERRRQIVSQMSGGEQQMVSIGRALMSSPRLLLLDELSLGLSPAVVDDIYRNLAAIIGTGLTVVIVEQDLKRALKASTRFVVMLEGRNVLEGHSGKVDEATITAAYFGVDHVKRLIANAGAAE
jgi:branched-chain amino acid transport system ATP-binding protein